MSSKTYFDQVAQKWDAMRASFFSEQVREKAYAAAQVRAGEYAADIGAGTGFIAEGLRQRGLRVIAVDQSEAMLAELSRRFDGIDCRLGGEVNLPIPSATMDHAFANMYLHHVESPRNAIQEMARIVKPGGKVVITDLDEHQFEFLRTEQSDRWMGFKREDVRQWFVGAGLKNVVVDGVGANCCADSKCGSEHARVDIFVASGEK
ncbi:MAG: methyltransferase domain-containing protein [Chloroflexota bacterium]|nr:methyltransferase domain-containing protein [Chloroflexota bacterium]